MKPEFNIGARNGLLEDKHLQKLGMAVWLYLWFIDRQTKNTDKVLGGQPITYELVSLTFGSLSRASYKRWLGLIRKGGYIETLRTPYGLVVTITKPKKWGDRSKMSHPDRSKMSHLKLRNEPSNKDNTVDNTIDVTNVTSKAYGSPEINNLFSYWQEATGLQITSRVKANRYAARNLLNKHGEEALKRLINGVAKTHSDQYAPRIADFTQLQQKTDELILWGKKQVITKGTIKI